MALPNQLETARMTDSTTASTIDNEVGDLEVSITDILGIPIDTNISNALFTVVAGGLTKVNFQDLSGSPSASGELARNGTVLEYHDGTAARVLSLLAIAQTWTADQSFNDNVNITLGTGGDVDLDYDGANTVLQNIVGSGNFLVGPNVTVGSSSVTPDGTLHVHTASAGSVTAESTADDLVVENSGDAGISLLSDTGACRIHFGDTEDNNIGAIVYDHAANNMTLVAGTTSLLVLGQATPGQVHVAPNGTADAELEVSDGSSIGAGDVHRAASTAHSSRHMKDIVKYYNAADERQCYDDVKALRPMRFTYRVGADPHDPQKPGTPNPNGKQHNGYFLDEAPDFIKAAPQIHGIVIDDRIMMLEMAMKEVIRKVEANP